MRGGIWTGLVVMLMCVLAAGPATGAGTIELQELAALGGGNVEDLVVRGSYAICSTGFGLAVFDVSNATDPSLVGTWEVPAYIRGLEASGKFLYVCSTYQPVRVYDISDPAHLALVATWEGAASACDIAISGNYAYLIPSPAYYHLEVLEVSDPLSPVSMGSYRWDTPCWEYGSIQIADGHAWAEYGSMLGVLDVSDPTAVKLLVNYRFPEVCQLVGVSGRRAYVTCSPSGLHVFDFSKPANPIEVGSLATEGVSRGGAIDGDLLYLLSSVPWTNSTIVQVLNTAGPSGLAKTSSLTIHQNLSSILLSGNRAYLSSLEEGLVVLDTDSVPPAKMGSYHSAITAEAVTVSGDRAYVLGCSNRIHAVDISDPTSPTLLGSYDLGHDGTLMYGEVEEMRASGDYVYLLTRDGLIPGAGLLALDFTTPSSPAKTSLSPSFVSMGATAMVVSPPWLYICDMAQSRLLAYDISEPGTPVQVGALDRWVRQVAPRGNIVYADDANAIYAIDVSDHSAPREIGQTPVAYYPESKLAASGGYLYSSTPADLEIFDISDPASPVLVGRYHNSDRTTMDVTVSGSYVYLSMWDRLLVLDVSDPADPMEVGSYQAWGMVRDAEALGRNIYVADRGRGLVLLRHPYPFMDLPSGFWAVDQIAACAKAEIVGGYADGSYRPDLSVTRDQMAVFIARGLAGSDALVPTAPVTATFSDIPTSHWAFKYAEYCQDEDIVSGYWDGYHPDETVNRAQMAVFAARAMAGGDGSIPAGPEMPSFGDVPTDHWAYKYVEYCRDQGVVTGYWDGYHPEAAVTRAQMAVYVQRAFGLPM